MLYREVNAVCSEIRTKYINTLCGQNAEYLRAFAKLRKATINFVISVSLSVRMEQLGSHWTDLQLNLIFEYSSKIYRKKFKFH